MLGVVGVVALLAAVLVPTVIRQVDEAARNKEAADLHSISNAIVLQVLNTRTVPDATGLAQSVANWSGYAVSQVAANKRRYARAFLVDTNGAFPWPYTQSATGYTNANPPANARILVLGTIATALPVATGRPSTAAFNDLWATPARTRPSTWSGWAGRGEDLVIQRIDLEPLFHHLVLVNRDPVPPVNAGFAIDSTNAVVLAKGVRRAYYLNGTDLGLYSGLSVQTNAQSRVLLDQDRSFVFQAGQWAGQFESVDSYSEVVGSDFAALAAAFLDTEWYPNAHKGGNQQGALVSMFNFMLTYQYWANQCPHFPTRGENRNNVPEYNLLLDMAGGGASSLLNSFTGTDGLLKRP